MRTFISSLSTWGRTLMLFLMLLAGAGVTHAGSKVTEADVAAAILASPGANQWLRDNAAAVANLARFESGLRTNIYNGSCCSGILQMNRTNIWNYTGVSPAVYRTWSLQQQVNAWTRLTVAGMRAGSVQQLLRMQANGQKFDGRTVDFNLVMACIQLGTGNCARMLRSGHCGGFKDKNGTTICKMADAMAGGRAGITDGYEDGSVSTRPIASFECRKNADGSCMSVDEAMRLAFSEGSGVEMETLRQLLRALLAATTFLVMGHGTLTAWKSYAKGVIEQRHMVHYMTRASIVVAIVMLILTIT